MKFETYIKTVEEIVKENYEFYKFTYKFPGALFRTDYAVSIACHLLAGQTGEEWASRISNQPMRYMDGKDDLADVDPNGWLFLSNDRQENWKNLAVRIHGENVHFMNKRGLLRHWEKAMEAKRNRSCACELYSISIVEKGWSDFWSTVTYP